MQYYATNKNNHTGQRRNSNMRPSPTYVQESLYSIITYKLPFLVLLSGVWCQSHLALMISLVHPPGDVLLFLQAHWKNLQTSSKMTSSKHESKYQINLLDMNSTRVLTIPFAQFPVHSGKSRLQRLLRRLRLHRDAGGSDEGVQGVGVLCEDKWQVNELIFHMRDTKYDRWNLPNYMYTNHQIIIEWDEDYIANDVWIINYTCILFMFILFEVESVVLL